MEVLDNIRMPKKKGSIKTQVFISLSMLIFGICLGTFSKFLDYRHASLPGLLRRMDEFLDFHNFLGGFAPWIVIAVCISVYSYTPIRASINVFTFFIGMVSSYYVYSYFVAGFLPKSYAFIWVLFTILSPFCAFLSWYAKGKGMLSLMISAGMISLLINTAFAYGVFYVDIRSWLNVMMLMFGVIVLHKSFKETIGRIGLSIILAIIVDIVIPFHIW